VRASRRPPVEAAAAQPSTTAPSDDERQGIFRPIVSSRAALEVVDQLTYAVLSGTYRPGDRLPTLDQLAAATGVSRPTVGEALRIMGDAGVLEARRGAKGGIVVKSDSVPTHLLKLSRQRRGRTLGELLEARRPIEIELCRLAAQRIDETGLAELERANDFLRASKRTRREWEQANNLFHYAIGRAAGNEPLAYYQHELLEELALLTEGYAERYSDRERTIREHEDTLVALRTRDPDVAAAAMDEHLRELEELVPRFDGARRGF
jgi:GntR family transcriptional regulator, transcriptional repressor for pyruvate dehydrogenase complex